MSSGVFGPLPLEQTRRVYVVSLSSGVSSALAADRAMKRYGADRVRLVFMDTRWEDEANYRFLIDLERHWGKPIDRLTEGRTPLQVADDEHIIPNQKIAPCTYRLKIEPFLAYIAVLKGQGYRVTILLGMGWMEQHRMDAPRKNYGERGYEVDYPLMWKPYSLHPFDEVRAWGIEPPRMYRMGYPHANCGGQCIKQGQGDWLRTLTYFPERFESVAVWEAKKREDPLFADYAILRDQTGGELKPLPLMELKARAAKRVGTQLPLFAGIEDDTTSCICNAGDPGKVAVAA